MKALLPLLAFAAVAGPVTLVWDPNPETDVNGYRVYHGKASRVYDHVADVTDTTATIDPGEPGVYYFAVTARNTAGLESDYSNEVVWTNTVSYPQSLNAIASPDGMSWTFKMNSLGMVQPTLHVPADPGAAVKASVTTPAGTVTRTVTVGASGAALFPGKWTAPPYHASGKLLSISFSTNITINTTVK